MDQFGGLAKSKEIMAVATSAPVPDAIALARKLLAEAMRRDSSSPFRRPVADDNGEVRFLPLEFGTILCHVKFADKLGLIVFRSADQTYLPGFEPTPEKYSPEMVDRKILKFLSQHGISMNRVAEVLGSIEFRDIESITEALLSRGRTIGEGDLQRCFRLLGDCGISLRYSRRKTYAVARSNR